MMKPILAVITTANDTSTALTISDTKSRERTIRRKRQVEARKWYWPRHSPSPQSVHQCRVILANPPMELVGGWNTPWQRLPGVEGIPMQRPHWLHHNLTHITSR